MYTYEQLIDKIFTDENNIDLSFEDAITFARILLKKGYAVMLTSGDLGDEYKLSWVYAGDGWNTKANRDNVVFADKEYIEMLCWHDYIEDENKDTD